MQITLYMNSALANHQFQSSSHLPPVNMGGNMSNEVCSVYPPAVTFPTIQQWTLHQNIIPLSETSPAFFDVIGAAQGAVDKIPGIGTFASTFLSVLTLFLNKDDTMSKLQSLDRKINLVEMRTALNLAQSEMHAVNRSMEIVLSGSSKISRQTEIVIALRSMDKLYNLFTNKNYAFWKYPIATAPHLVSYVALHRTICNLVVKLKPQEQTYKKQCDSTKSGLNDLLKNFSQHFIKVRVDSGDIEYDMSGIQYWIGEYRMSWSVTRGTPHVTYMITDPFNFAMPVKSSLLFFPRYIIYSFRRMKMNDYKNELRILYQSFFMNYVEYPKTVNGNRSVGRSCYFESPLTSRVECGWAGISKTVCESRGCCWDNVTPGVKWCFKSNNKNTNIARPGKSANFLECANITDEKRWLCGLGSKRCETGTCCFNPKIPRWRDSPGEFLHCFNRGEASWYGELPEQVRFFK